ncbi:MAG: hypothetical protein KBF98_09925 [Rhodoferax sp.]|nr:hypothetical protein [Rhodoferax sp.]
MNENIVFVDFSGSNIATKADAIVLKEAVQDAIYLFGELEFAQAIADQSDCQLKAVA